MKIELTDDEVTTVMVALDNYRDQKEQEWATTRDEADIEDAGSAEWLWQKLFGAQQEFRNSVADAVGEGEQPQLPFNTQTNSGTSASVDPFDLGMASQYDNMGDI